MLISELARAIDSYRPLVYGAILIIIVFFMPKGLVGLREYIPEWYKKLAKRFRKESG